MPIQPIFACHLNSPNKALTRTMCIVHYPNTYYCVSDWIEIGNDQNGMVAVLAPFGVWLFPLTYLRDKQPKSCSSRTPTAIKVLRRTLILPPASSPPGDYTPTSHSHLHSPLYPILVPSLSCAMAQIINLGLRGLQVQHSASSRLRRRRADAQYSSSGPSSSWPSLVT